MNLRLRWANENHYHLHMRTSIHRISKHVKLNISITLGVYGLVFSRDKERNFIRFTLLDPQLQTCHLWFNYHKYSSRWILIQFSAKIYILWIRFGMRRKNWEKDLWSGIYGIVRKLIPSLKGDHWGRFFEEWILVTIPHSFRKWKREEGSAEWGTNYKIFFI